MIGLPGGKLFLLHDRDTLRDAVEASRVSRGCHHHGGNVGTSDEGILVWDRRTDRLPTNINPDHLSQVRALQGMDSPCVESVVNRLAWYLQPPSIPGEQVTMG